jgi:glycosyltransferase involved in cell wall biosynthesis
MPAVPPAVDNELTVLNVVVSSPSKRGGAIRAGLQLGDHLESYVNVDTVKMAGEYDELLVEELKLSEKFNTTPSRTLLRNIGRAIIGSAGNYENTVIWTELSTPRPLGEYDVAHFHNAVPLWGLLSAAIRCRLAGVPYVMTTHGISKIPDLPKSMGMSDAQEFIFSLAFLRPYRWILNNAEVLFALSESDEQRLNEMLPGVQTTIVPNGVRLNLNDSDTDILDFDIPSDSPLLLFVGKLIESKGIGDLLDAYERLDTECTLIIAGPPAAEEYVDRLNQFDKANVRYLGYVDQDVLEALYRRADLFVFPTRSDVFPLVTLEALAAGTPVVSTTVGGIPEQITSETGILVPPERPDKITGAVEELLNDDKRRATMSEAAISRAETEYSWDGVARKTVEMYERICE